MAYADGAAHGNPADPELDGAGHTNGHADDGAAAEIDITSTDLPAFLTEDEPGGVALNGASAP